MGLRKLHYSIVWILDNIPLVMQAEHAYTLYTVCHAPLEL